MCNAECLMDMIRWLQVLPEQSLTQVCRPTVSEVRSTNGTGRHTHLWYRETISVSFSMRRVLRAPCTHSRTTPAQRPPAKPSTSLLTAFRWLSLTSNIRDQYGPASGLLSAVSLPSPCNQGNTQDETQPSPLLKHRIEATPCAIKTRWLCLKDGSPEIGNSHQRRAGASDLFNAQCPAGAREERRTRQSVGSWVSGGGQFLGA